MGGAKVVGLYPGQEGEVTGVLIPGCAVVGTCSPRDVFVLVDKNWLVLLCNAKVTGRGVLWCWGRGGTARESQLFLLSAKYTVTGPGDISEVLVLGSLLRSAMEVTPTTSSLVVIHFCPHSLGPWGLRGARKVIPQAAPTTRGYLRGHRGREARGPVDMSRTGTVSVQRWR